MKLSESCPCGGKFEAEGSEADEVRSSHEAFLARHEGHERQFQKLGTSSSSQVNTSQPRLRAFSRTPIPMAIGFAMNPEGVQNDG